ncbi:MAG TPA: NmrA/HSCARG family protein [Planctomycetota bacterium]|nr:NmrA/HSCARG family protein [Planctomycetota bacterium]
MAKKIIAVVGATGAQGGGLARAILDDPAGGFALRAITRDPKGAKAQEFARRGAEVVAADVDDAASLTRAFQGCHGAFCVTFFWDHFSADKETAQAGAMARAAKDAGVTHAVWSTLEDTRKLVPLSDARMPTLGGRWKVPHFDGKGAADEIFRSLAVPTTFLLTSFYWDNLIQFGMGPKPGADGKLAFVLPMADKKLPGIAVEDIGRCAYGVFRRGGDLVGKTVGIAGEHLTGTQMAAALSKALRREVVYQYVPPEIYRTFGFPGADDLANMFQYKRDFERQFCGARDVGVSRSLNPRLQTFEEWLRLNASRIPVG